MIIRTKTKVKTGFEIETQEKTRKISIKKLLFLIKVLKNILASLLLIRLIGK